VIQTGQSTVYKGTLADATQLATALREKSLLVSLGTRTLTRMIMVTKVMLNWLYQLAGVSGGEVSPVLTTS
jgi:hypothetical protein